VYTLLHNNIRLCSVYQRRESYVGKRELRHAAMAQVKVMND